MRGRKSLRVPGEMNILGIVSVFCVMMFINFFLAFHFPAASSGENRDSTVLQNKINADEARLTQIEGVVGKLTQELQKRSDCPEEHKRAGVHSTTRSQRPKNNDLLRSRPCQCLGGNSHE
jgi:hypothetical protein